MPSGNLRKDHIVYSEITKPSPNGVSATLNSASPSAANLSTANSAQPALIMPNGSLPDRWQYQWVYPYIWQCSAQILVRWIHKNLGHTHLQVGCSSSWLLALATAGKARSMTLADPNLNRLKKCQQQLSQHHRISSFQYDFTEKMAFGGQQFSSIGIGNLLNQLPGSLDERAHIFDDLQPHLSDGGKVVGWLLAMTPSTHSAMATLSMAKFRHLNILHTKDPETVLQQALNQRFNRVAVKRIGHVVLFAAGY
ncbi:Uncharacterised protein [BD1-7 clade bacterium]|uniref:Methyltransferase domain-containing protein n=1 Tax=BD1-7 clade bacterium TaxID=2029982 RepID=A0A5S9MSV2_9GAMM|nr:Uncharacterised protein [BD1-7 clade bacterium]CAA0084471.1 Uncharacterised protein [BD1-7 clade bacterium]